LKHIISSQLTGLFFSEFQLKWFLYALTTSSSFCRFFVKFNNVIEAYKINRFSCYQLCQCHHRLHHPGLNVLRQKPAFPSSGILSVIKVLKLRSPVIKILKLRSPVLKSLTKKIKTTAVLRPTLTNFLPWNDHHHHQQPARLVV
jgi:hypothetical protein